MKSKIALLATCFLLTVFSCKDEEAVPSQSVTATIDGTSFKALYFTGTYEPGGISQVIATAQNDDRLVFTLSSSTTPGTYDLNTSGSINVVFYKANGVAYVADDGEFILSKFTESQFECTFNLNASLGSTVISISQGTARVHMVKQ